MNVLPNIPNTLNIVEYNDVDPMSVLHLTMLALDFPLTPEHAAHIRCTDPRPFPCFTVNAVENDVVLGQVGVFRLPMISTEGREDVGGVWAVSTHPNYARRGIASTLLDETHTRIPDIYPDGQIIVEIQDYLDPLAEYELPTEHNQNQFRFSFRY